MVYHRTPYDLQEKTVGSVPDATISQEGFKIVVETKMDDGFNTQQLINHLNAFGEEKFKVIMTLAPELMSSQSKEEFENDLKEYNTTQKYPILHVNTTFEKLVNGIREYINENDYEMHEVLDDFINYCYKDGLIVVSNAWKMMKMQLTSKTFEFNFRENIYYNAANTVYREHDYLGLYTNKSIRAIGKIESIITILVNNDDIEYTIELGELNEEKKEKIRIAIEDARNYGFQLTNERFFFVERFYETDYKKTSLYAPRGNRNFDLSEILNLSVLPETQKIAELLKEKEWM